MEELMCPRCGSRELNKLGSGEYSCPECGTGFMLINADTDLVDVVLNQAGMDRFKVMLILRELSIHEADVQMMDIVAAGRMIDSAPCVVAPQVSRAVAERIRATLEKAGATVELKSVQQGQ